MHVSSVILLPDLFSVTLTQTGFLAELPRNPTAQSVYAHAVGYAGLGAEYLDDAVPPDVFRLTVQRLEARAWAEIEAAEVEARAEYLRSHDRHGNPLPICNEYARYERGL